MSKLSEIQDVVEPLTADTAPHEEKDFEAKDFFDKDEAYWSGVEAGRIELAKDINNIIKEIDNNGKTN